MMIKKIGEFECETWHTNCGQARHVQVVDGPEVIVPNDDGWESVAEAALLSIKRQTEKLPV